MFHIKSERSAFEKFYFFFLKEYSFVIDDVEIDATKILMEFVKGNFLFEHSTAINQPLINTHGPFIIESLTPMDFKKYSGDRFLEVLVDFMNEDSWGDDLPDFRKLVHSSNQIVNEYGLSNDEIYLLNKDWFDSSSYKIDIYNVFTYFLTLVVINISKQRLLLIDYGYD